MRILVADDQSFWRRALEESLLEKGHHVTSVESGEKAWQLLCSESDVSLLVTDWVMEGMSGPELCRRVRSMERERYLPIILMTSRSGPEDLVAALEAGADAFVRKPFDEPELMAQIRVVERILALETRLANRIEDLHTARERIERDLAQAAEVQRSFMPATPPPVPGVEFAWHYESCAHLGGDLFNVFRLSEDHVGVHVLDVSGHGTSAALHSVTLSNVLHPLPQQGGILKRIGPDGRSWAVRAPSEVAAELSRRFPLIERSGHYATFLYGILEIRTRRFRYVNAGHPGPIQVSGTSAHCWNGGGGVPIGVDPEACYLDQEIQLQAGDALLLLTDGVTEARSERDEEFGLERVLDATRGAPGGAQAVVDALRRQIEDFRKLEPARDDVTMVALRVS